MTQTEPRTTAKRIETVVVDFEDIIAAFERNGRDETERRRHVLRVSHPFEGERRATPRILDEPSSADSDDEPTPIDLGPEAFVNVHGDYDPKRTRIPAPSREESRSIARNDHDENVDEETIEEYHSTAVAAWKECVRTSLVDEVLLPPDPDLEPEETGRTPVRYEGDV
ncbi:hypothetical protein [Halostagnicola sp. A-GB9-2]|uniref:hypothetical protein n=1 Tax=Halostagnicola sp. A-GB9-2 TaxID=3048066 RepID=UPI0024BF2145|nr:hypothetical protein [Halostagnicola sp. A-GB9-2]MDJ1434662.1 hypothetical protein [Halostagnicola sp. A-GB9-2]